MVLAGPPVAALNFWLGGLVERQGHDELKLSALRNMALAEARISHAIVTLEEVAARGVDSCRPASVEAMRQATFGATPVKELSIVASDGRTLCTDVGNQPEQRTVVWSEPVAAGGPTLMELVRLGGRSESWIRIRRPGNGSANGIAALIPTMLFLPQVSNKGGVPSFCVKMATASGALIGKAGAEPPNPNGDGLLVVTEKSERYALETVIKASRADLASSHGDLRALGAAATGFLALLIFALTFLLSRREQRGNPVFDIEQALKAGEFVPYYQPIVDIRSGRLRGAEVLIRWRKPDGSVVLPGLFIPLAESSGLIIEMTRSLMKRVCRELGPTLGLRPHLRIGFNLTARHLANEEIVEDVRNIFKRSPLRISQLVLEVTERQPIENLTETRRVVAALQGLGAKVAIDDVGTGHSGLSYMLKLGVDIIKIDKMFIDSLGIDRNSNTIIETLIDLAHNMRMEVIAEGVESFEQVVHLRELGVRAAQGYVFAPPLPTSAFLQLVETIEPLKTGGQPADETPAGKAAAVMARFDAA